eukprot:jgi/Bigna1/143638/aug1.80_g18346
MGSVKKGQYATFTKLPLVPGYQISGVVERTGSSVQGISKGDKVAAILPIDKQQGGLAEYVSINYINVVKMGEGVSFQDAAAVLLDGLKAVTSLFIQITAQLHDIKVILVSAMDDELECLVRPPPHLARVIDPREESVVACIMKETGGLGVDAILDIQGLFDFNANLHPAQAAATKMEGKKKTTTIDDKTNNKEKKEKMKARAGGMDMVGDDYARDYSAFDEKDKDKRIAGVRDDDEDKGKGKDDEKDKHDEDGGGGGDRERRLESSIGAGIDVPGNDDRSRFGDDLSKLTRD